ncbi:MAG: DNA gyrase subunit A [Actinomycetia bacterium]|nr:DNA gyrase subunit A [Actinomycetes bacterium]MCH9800500.1 DNA gyrase subunit A [Actinomycetes bacterium]
MKKSYMDYAMSVIVSRALPDVRDGLKPVHRRVIFAMYDGGYRPDRGYSKCARVVGDVMGHYHPHGDSAIYDTLVRLAQPWSLRYPLVDGQGNFGSPGNDPAAAMRYTECRMKPLAMEIVRDIDEETVDFQPNYDGKTEEPLVLPARFPNLLVNGSAGIAVGMATNIPPHNLREVAAGALWALENPEASREELLTALLERVKGPDFPTGGIIVGRRGIDEAYRTGRGSIVTRARVEVEEDSRSRQLLIVTELPYQVNPDNLLLRIAELVREGKLSGIADVRDDSSSRTGMRLVIELKRDAVAQVVLNNLYKHTQLQDSFGANMLALVNGKPRTLALDQFITYWIAHQIEVIQRRSRFRLRKAEERAHILRGYLKALDAIDEVVALIRASATVDAARAGLMELLEIDEVQATAILDMQLRRLAALERQKILDEYEELMTRIADLQDILARPERQRLIVSEELSGVVEKYGDERRTEFAPWEGDMADEDFIAETESVVTITHSGYAKRTALDLYRSQRRGGKGVRGAQLRADDVVQHLFVTSTHNWVLFFTNKGRVYRAKTYQLPEVGRDGKGQHVANLLAFQPDEEIAQVLPLRTYEDQPFLVLATRNGRVKKTRLSEYNSPRTGGIIAINLVDDDEVISAELLGEAQDLLLVSRTGMSVRFTANDQQLRAMGRSTSGVGGIKLRSGDELLAMQVAEDEQYLVTLTDGGYGKRTPVSEWSRKNRNIQGVRAMRLVADRGGLVGALVCQPGDEVLAIADTGTVIRTPVEQIRATGRDTMGVAVMGLANEQSVVAVARAAEQEFDDEELPEADTTSPASPEQGDSAPDGQQPGSLGSAGDQDATTEADQLSKE